MFRAHQSSLVENHFIAKLKPRGCAFSNFGPGLFLKPKKAIYRQKNYTALSVLSKQAFKNSCVLYQEKHCSALFKIRRKGPARALHFPGLPGVL